MFAFLQKLEPKDILALCVGCMALLISMGTFVHSITSKAREARKSAQVLFDKALIDLVELRKDREDYRLEYGDEWGRQRFGTLRIVMNDRRELLLSQTTSLLKNYSLESPSTKNLSRWNRM